MTAISASTTQVTIIAANGSRKGLRVVNNGPSTLYMSTVNGFTIGDEPIKVDPGGRFKLQIPYTGAYYGRSDQALGNYQVTEW